MFIPLVGIGCQILSIFWKISYFCQKSLNPLFIYLAGQSSRYILPGFSEVFLSIWISNMSPVKRICPSVHLNIKICQQSSESIHPSFRLSVYLSICLWYESIVPLGKNLRMKGLHYLRFLYSQSLVKNLRVWQLIIHSK